MCVLNILIISNVFPPGFIGGYELGAYEIAMQLRKRGHAVDVLTSNVFVADDDSDRGGPQSPRIFRTLDCPDLSVSLREAQSRHGVSGFVIPRNIREVTTYCVQHKPDVVLCFNLAGLGAPSILHLLAGMGLRPVLFLMDNVFHLTVIDPARFERFSRIMPPDFWLARSTFLYMSQNLRSEVEGKLGHVPGKQMIVPGWIDPQVGFAMRPLVSNQTKRFVFASRIAQHKGIGILLQACVALVKQGQLDFTVDVYGSGETASFLQQVTALKLQDIVRYGGSPDKSSLMAKLPQYDALVFPTWHREPFGFIVPEAAVAGCIPIMTHGIGAAEWYLDGLDCLKISAGTESLAAAMLQVISMPIEQQDQMRCRSRATTLSYLGLDNAVDLVESALLASQSSEPSDYRRMEAAVTLLTEIMRGSLNHR